MPQYRFIIEGSDFMLPTSFEDGEQNFATGFFTTRKASAADKDTAEARVLQTVSDEWAKHGPRLTVLDSWRVGLIELRRVPNMGHVFFSDASSRYSAASIEADVSRAPRDAEIWRLARLDVGDDE